MGPPKKELTFREYIPYNDTVSKGEAIYMFHKATDMKFLEGTSMEVTAVSYSWSLLTSGIIASVLV